MDGTKGLQLAIFVTAAAALSSCGKEQLTAEEQAARDAEKIAAVEAAQAPPAQLVFPEVITFEDITANKLFGTGCEMQAPPPAEGSLTLTGGEYAYIKIDGEIVRLAADAGSSEQPFGARRKYDGKAHSLTLDTEGEPIATGYEGADYVGVMTLRDGRDRVVFQQEGTVRCGA